MVLIQLDVGTFIISSMPGGSVERLVNTVHPKTQKTPESPLKPETRACQTQKDREFIISVNKRPLSEKSPSPGVFHYRLFLWKGLCFCVS